MTMSSLRMDFTSINQQSNHQELQQQQQSSISSCSSDVSSVVSSDSDWFEEEEEEVESSSSPSSPSSGSNSSSGPLQDMASLLQELPFKRGLSKHYNGKSQSFTSLANARCLEDLAKPENPYNKRIKSCKSYAMLEIHRSSQPHRSASSSRLIFKKPSRGSICSSLISGKRNGSFLGNRPPMASTSTSTFANQAPLFA